VSDRQSELIALIDLRVKDLNDLISQATKNSIKVDLELLDITTFGDWVFGIKQVKMLIAETYIVGMMSLR